MKNGKVNELVTGRRERPAGRKNNENVKNCDDKHTAVSGGAKAVMTQKASNAHTGMTYRLQNGLWCMRHVLRVILTFSRPPPAQRSSPPHIP